MINFKNALNRILANQNWFTNMYYSWKTIDTTPYDRTQIIEAYKNGSEVRLVLEKVINSFTSIPVRWVDKNGDPIEDLEQDELLKNPNDIQTQKQFENNWCLENLLFDECFIHGGTVGIGLDKGKPEFLKMLPGQYVDFKLDDNGNILYYVNTYNTNIKIEKDAVSPTIGNVLDPQETLHATSKIITASKIIKKIEQGHDMDITAYGNKGANYLVAAREAGSFDKEKASNMQEELNNKELKGGIRFTGAQVDVHDISKTPTDLNVLETSKDSRKVLAMLYGVPLPLVSEDASTYDNVRSAEETLALNVTIPLKQLFCEKITKFLDDGKGNKLEVDLKKVRQIQKDPKEAQEELNGAKASTNERRDAAGLPRLKGAQYDEPIYALNDQIGIAPDFSPSDLGI